MISEIRVQNDNFQQINQQREDEINQLRCQLIDKEKDLNKISETISSKFMNSKLYKLIENYSNSRSSYNDYDFDYEHAPTPGEAIWEFVEEQLSDTDIKTLKRMILPKHNQYGGMYLKILKEFERKEK